MPRLSVAVPTLLLGSAAAQGAWKLNLLDMSTYPMAQCLDGTAGGFYFSAGSGSGSNSWLIHTQGGGWAVSLEDAVARSHTALGSSSSWSPTSFSADGGQNGMLSSDVTVNPNLWNWNKVFIGYCDGGSYAGGVLAPTDVNGTTIYMRGHYILDAVYDTLLTSYGMQSATNVVIKGCSAGGLAVYLHADYLADKIHAVNASTRVVAAPGAGFFMDLPSYAGPYVYTPVYQSVFQYQNVSAWINAACMAAHAPADAWMCYMAQYTLPFIRTPMFISNSLGDAWQLGNIMQLGCNPGQNCDVAQMAYFDNYRLQMLSAMQPVLRSASGGGFLQECVVHVVEDDSGSWNGILVQNQTQAQTFWAWFTGSTTNALATVVDGPFGNNTSCGKYAGRVHIRGVDY